MELLNYADSPLSLLPPVIALSMAIFSRRVLLSLGLGIIIGALLLVDFSPVGTIKYILTAVKELFIKDDGPNSWNLSIIGFLLLLGMITALLTLSGGTRAFAIWAEKRIRNKRGAKMLAATLGIFIFVDDYFNSLVVGAVARPVTDKFHVSRAKLAYILDSTAAPVCVLVPVSSWGAYVITLISGILINHHVNNMTALNAFFRLIPMNFYAVFALLMVPIVIWFRLDFRSMRQQDKLAQTEGYLNDAEDKKLHDELNIVESEKGRISDLLVPIIILVITTIFFMIFTGYEALAKDGKAFSILGTFENTDVGMSLCYGGTIGLIASLYTVVRQRIAIPRVLKTMRLGLQSMSGAILILCFAWLIGGVIKEVETGKYLSTLVHNNMNPQLLPLILFTLAGLMAFSTGTSWGTFGIMLPLAGDLAAATDTTLILPVLAAVLAGSVFGDHCSPISDTTILSSTGAKCNHIDHVSTQLPYAVTVALLSAVGYLILGLTGSSGIAFFSVFGLFVLTVAIMAKLIANARAAEEVK